MKITKRPFGTLADGTAVSCWTMENAHGLRAELLDYGATIRSVQVPDRAGRLIDVVLGYDDLAGYAGNPSFYGATIGRFGNRIGGAEFALNGKTYWLAKTTVRTICTAVCAALTNTSGRERRSRTVSGSRASRRTARRGIPAR